MRIVVVDDHPLVRKGLEMVASLEEDIEIAGCAANSEEALALIQEERPDVALVDLRLPGENGLDIIKKARELNSNNGCKYIILSSYATKDEIRRAMAEKVDGYILKEALPEELISSIRLVAKGRRYYDPIIMQQAMEDSGEEEDRLSGLTARERDVLAALAQGKSNKAIADSLFISEHTVKKHIGQILTKLELRDRTQAALFAVSKGLDK
ncbi:MAG TPA: response regulator transcription factor [Firmicutes bacterium]|nr:response regulator transcription factor [Bacillota bacterium]